MVSTGWPAVEAKCGELGIGFRWWQVAAGRLILAKRKNGKYAATVGGTGLSIPRQVGKTYLVAAIVFALCLLRPKLTVVWTAHMMRTAEETFGKMQVFAKRRTIAPFIAKIVLGSGEEEIRFRNGSRILFGARERGFGRGFDEVDVLIYDEAQKLSESALDDMIPATNQSRQDTGALLLFLGTPPKPTDNGEVFKRMRSEALSGEDRDTGWVEFGVDPDFNPTPPPAPLSKADWEQVAKANPSFPDDTPRESILRMRKKLGPDSFLREGLGIWDPEEVEDSVISSGQWAALIDTAAPGRMPSFAVEVALDRAWTSIAAAGLREDGRIQVELVDRRRGTGWVIARCKELAEHDPDRSFVVDGKGPAGSLIDDMQRDGLYVLTAGTADIAQATAELVDGVDQGLFAHGPDDLLDAAVRGSRPRPLGDGTFALGRRKSTDDVTPLVAVSLAAWGLQVSAVGVNLW